MLRHRKAERNVPVIKRTAPRTGLAHAVAEATAGGSAAERALRIVTEIAEAGVGLSLADLSARLDLPKATLHRQCAGLLAQGYLARDVDPLRFVVGPALHKLAFITLNHGHVRALRHRVLAELVAEVQETCNFTTLDGAEVLYLDRVEARWPLRLTLDVGAHVPLHCTASGKLFLAHLPPPQFDELVGRARLQAFTANTIASPAQLRSECDAIRAAGYSTDREEFIAGLIALAAPVYDADNVLRAAIAMHAPTARLALDDALKRLPRLLAAARQMRGLL
jgi:IclR family transcriptional regulator, acetate operon repressor